MFSWQLYVLHTIIIIPVPVLTYIAATSLHWVTKCKDLDPIKTNLSPGATWGNYWLKQLCGVNLIGFHFTPLSNQVQELGPNQNKSSPKLALGQLLVEAIIILFPCCNCWCNAKVTFHSSMNWNCKQLIVIKSPYYNYSTSSTPNHGHVCRIKQVAATLQRLFAQRRL